MCGITGILNLENEDPVSENTLKQMLGMIRHRGPDGFGIYLDDHVGLGSARLSIIGLSSGDQPISNEDGSLWIVFNGEIFNYIELRPPLEARGHQFATLSDTEVILHLYEDFGPDCLKQLNGQFAIAIWDVNRRSLFLARDRLGIRPLFYTRHNGKLIFGSEVKCLFATRTAPRRKVGDIDVVFKDGRLLMFFGEAGESEGNLLLPAKVTIDYDNLKYFERHVEPSFQPRYLVLVTSQFGPRRVNVFAYGQEKGRKYPTDAELLKQVEELRKKEQQKAPPPAPKPDEKNPEDKKPGGLPQQQPAGS